MGYLAPSIAVGMRDEVVEGKSKKGGEGEEMGRDKCEIRAAIQVR